jgi:hypothetical protein
LGCFDSISSPRTGVEAILTELGPENQNWRYAVSSHTSFDAQNIVSELLSSYQAQKLMTYHGAPAKQLHPDTS